MEYQSLAMWNNEVKEKLNEALKISKSDPNFIREAEYLLNKLDSMFIDMPSLITEKISPIANILTSTQYYLHVHSSSMPDEIKILKEIGEMLSAFNKILRYEFREEIKEEVKLKDRLPNSIPDVKDIYGPKDLGKERLF